VTVAATLIILVGFTALAIDSGVLYADRTQSQRAADAAALAGAVTFVVDTKSSRPATAEAHARAAALNNTVMGVPIASAEVDVCVGDASSGTYNTDAPAADHPLAHVPVLHAACAAYALGRRPRERRDRKHASQSGAEAGCARLRGVLDNGATGGAAAVHGGGEAEAAQPDRLL